MVAWWLVEYGLELPDVMDYHDHGCDEVFYLREYLLFPREGQYCYDQEKIWLVQDGCVWILPRKGLEKLFAMSKRTIWKRLEDMGLRYKDFDPPIRAASCFVEEVRWMWNWKNEKVSRRIEISRINGYATL